MGRGNQNAQSILKKSIECSSICEKENHSCDSFDYPLLRETVWAFTTISIQYNRMTGVGGNVLFSFQIFILFCSNFQNSEKSLFVPYSVIQIYLQW